MLSLAAGAIGVWFFLTERAYANTHGNALADTLQWVGLAVAMLGAAGVLMGAALAAAADGRRDRAATTRKGS